MGRRTETIQDYTKTLCPTCGCCSVGRMGTCVGGCGPRGGRSKHDKASGSSLSASTARRTRKTTTGTSGDSQAALSAMSERQFQHDVVDGLKQRGYAVWTVPDMRKTARGLPDVIALGPLSSPFPRLLFWELKSATGRIRPEQANTILHLQRASGVDARIVRPSDWARLSEEV